MTEHEDLQGRKNDLPTEPEYDDILDAIFRDLVSREIARRENREEGRTVIVEPRPTGTGVSSRGWS